MEKVCGWDLEIVEIGGRRFALDGWNGEVYLNCWEIDKDGMAIDDAEYEIRPVYIGVGEADEDGDYEEYEIKEYVIC